MLDYKDILSKYGLKIDVTPHIPSEKEVQQKLIEYEEFIGTLDDFEFTQFVTIFMSISDPQSSRVLKIVDHKLFFSSFNLSIDTSKVHPDVLYLFELTLRLDNDNKSFDFAHYNPFRDLSGEKTDNYLGHFSRGYAFAKMFFDEPVYETLHAFQEYLDTTVTGSFEKSNINHFLNDFYEYIVQEQNALKSE